MAMPQIKKSKQSQKTRETAMVFYDTCEFTSFFAESTSLKFTLRG